MINRIKNGLKKDIIQVKGGESDITISDIQLNDALEKVSIDIVYNYLIFKEDVTYEKFLGILKKLIWKAKN